MSHKVGVILCFLLWPVFCGGAVLDLSIEANATPNPVKVGEPITCAIVLTNASQATATAIALTNSLDPTLSIQSAIASSGTVEIGESKVILQVDSLAGGSAVSLEIVAIPTQARFLTFVSVAMAAEPEEVLWNNSFTLEAEAKGVPNVPPTITIEAPVIQDGVVDAFAVVEITAQPLDSDGAIAKVQFFMDSFEVAERSAPPFSLQIPAIRPGSYTLTALTADNLGAVASAQIQIATREVETNKFIFPRHSDGVFKVFFSGHYHEDFVIEAQNAGSPLWIAITQFTRTNFSALISEPAVNSPRIYRARKIEP